MHTQRAQGGWFTWADTPRMTLLDVAALLWAERMLIVMVSGAIVALGLTAALMAPKTYTARTELLVRLGEEYVYQPTAGANAAGAGAAGEYGNLRPYRRRRCGLGAHLQSRARGAPRSLSHPAGQGVLGISDAAGGLPGGVVQVAGNLSADF